MSKAIKGAEVSIFVGVFAAVLATLIGTLLGAVAGFFGGRVGDFLEWVYNVFTSIPGILLIFAFAAVLGRGIGTVVLILGLTGWTGIYRLVRAEYIKHRDARVRARRRGHRRQPLLAHVPPHPAQRQPRGPGAAVAARGGLHQGRGDPVVPRTGRAVDQVSWGTMLSEAQTELVLGHWWQLVATTIFMALFVTAFSLLTDALRDALDPKLR